MQDNKVFKYLNYLFKFFLCISFIVSLLQNYYSSNGTIEFLGFTLSQFYPNTDRRIFPLLLITFFTFPLIKKILNIKGGYYFSEMLLSLLCATDAFTHINNIYSSSFVIPLYGRIWFDKIAHFLEGLILLPVYFPLVLNLLNKYFSFRISKILSYFSAIGLSSIFFILWEILELFIDSKFGTHLITDPTDTNEDLFFAYSGFVVAIFFMELFYFLKYSFMEVRAKSVNRVIKYFNF